MKWTIFLMLAFGIFFSACKKDEIQPLVPITGTFVNTPDPAGGFWEVTLPDGSVMPIPKKYKVSGQCTFVGTVDETKSFLETSDIVFNPLYGFDGNLKITLYDADGDQLIHVGEYYSFQDLSNKSYLHYDGGTGKFEGAEGWLITTGQVDPVTGINTLTAAGEITKPLDK